MIVGSLDQAPDNSETIFNFSLVFRIGSIFTKTLVPSGNRTLLGSRIDPFFILLFTVIIMEFLQESCEVGDVLKLLSFFCLLIR